MNDGTRILIVDRNRYHALLLDRQIHHQLESAITSVFRGLREALEELQRNTYAIMVVDYSLLQEAGVELSELSNTDDAGPAIILTAAPKTVDRRSRSRV